VRYHQGVACTCSSWPHSGCLYCCILQYKPKKEYYGEEKHEESYSEYKPKKEEPKYYKEEKHEEAYEVRLF
jgi:hypothetical protein